MASSNKQTLLREIPSVDRLLKSPVANDMVAKYGRTLTTASIRQHLDTIRTKILVGNESHLPQDGAILHEADEWLNSFLTPTLQPVINATGVIVHTNLGRAPLSQSAIQAMQAVAQNYSTLEYDIDAGARGSRSVHAEQQLQHITHAESALVVNNNASAVMLMLNALCKDREVIISRGQLVEIGGGFRIPDVMAQSGAHLVEVGTTNRTHLYDYENAITENTAAILVAHHSNYKIIGFSSEPSLEELAQLAHKHGLPLLYDQGSGALLDCSPYGLEPEPTVLDGLEAGCDVVAFSGDKLLGGPQAGILVGNANLIAACKKHPLARAVRADKLCLAGLAATLTHYLTEQALAAIPIWQMISRSLADVEAEANAWAKQLQAEGIEAEVVNGRSTVGGGSLPGTDMPTKLVSIKHEAVDELAKELRLCEFPLVGRIQDGRFLLDPRTVLPNQTENLLQSVKDCVK